MRVAVRCTIHDWRCAWHDSNTVLSYPPTAQPRSPRLFMNSISPSNGVLAISGGLNAGKVSLK